jgi:hypothetical protein
MTETIDDLTISFTEEGLEKIKELGKYILSRGAWTTILFRYQEWENKNQAYGAVKYSLRRYKKEKDRYRLNSKFTISSNEQARKIIEVLNDWLDN